MVAIKDKHQEILDSSEFQAGRDALGKAFSVTANADGSLEILLGHPEKIDPKALRVIQTLGLQGRINDYSYNIPLENVEELLHFVITGRPSAKAGLNSLAEVQAAARPEKSRT